MASLTFWSRRWYCTVLREHRPSFQRRLWASSKIFREKRKNESKKEVLTVLKLSEGCTRADQVERSLGWQVSREDERRQEPFSRSRNLNLRKLKICFTKTFLPGSTRRTTCLLNVISQCCLEFIQQTEQCFWHCHYFDKRIVMSISSYFHRAVTQERHHPEMGHSSHMTWLESQDLTNTGKRLELGFHLVFMTLTLDFDLRQMTWKDLTF